MEKKMLGREMSDVKSRIKSKEEVKVVSVIYYIARNGQLDHPHLMELPLSSHAMLSLKDVINRLNFLRGKGMAHSYSWSAKRSYKKGYVWQDLSENDFIYPCDAQNDEYVLKATQLLQLPPSSTSIDYSSETTTSSTRDSDSPAGITKTKKKTNETWHLAAINASTQTDENQEEENESEEHVVVEDITTAVPVSGNMIKESSSSSSSNMREYCRMENKNLSGRMKAFTVLIQLMRCVSSKKLI